MIIFLALCFYGTVHFANGMEDTYGVSFHQLHEEAESPLRFFGEISLANSGALKSKRDLQGNTVLHALAAHKSLDYACLKTFVIDCGFSVCEKNLEGEDVWLHGMLAHKSDPSFFKYFDLLYHGPTITQWHVLCGESLAVLGALDDNPKLLFAPDQRGYPLVYYAWTHKTLLKQLLEKGALSESAPEIYQKVIGMWLFRGQQEAKCGRKKEHKKMLDAIKIVFCFSKELLKAHASEFAPRAAYVGRDLLKSIFDQLAPDQQATKSLVEKALSRIKEERKKPLNEYYSAILQETYSYLADA